jgi:nicotinamide-nucleotide amidase
VVGDEPDELLAALRDGLERDLLVVTGGLGPTHDDRSVALLGRALGSTLRLDAALEARIEAVSRPFAARSGRAYDEYAPGVRKQATIPEGAVVVGLAGTAPALLLEHPGGLALALPGPPRELQALWPAVLACPPFARLLERVVAPSRRVQRFYGVGESVVGRALDEAGAERDGLEVTICARDYEIQVDLLVSAGGEQAADELESALGTELGEYLFARSERSIEELVLERCVELDLRIATAESCTGGAVAARLSSVPGASAALLGGVIAYADAVKESELGVSPATLATHGAVSAQSAQEMARGVRERLGAEVGIAVTGIAGPGGATPEKPVGLVYLCASAPGGELAEELRGGGDRDAVRARATVAALHLVYRLLAAR